VFRGVSPDAMYTNKKNMQKEEEKDYIAKLICASVASHYNSNRQIDSLHATAQSKSSYLKTLEVQD
jgi:hypothetical protein